MWASLPAAEREKMDEAEVMCTEAAAQGHPQAHCYLGTLLLKRGDIDGAEAAYRGAIAADPGFASTHFSLAILLQYERKDFDGAEAAYRAAIAADPKCTDAHNNLNLLLKT